MPQWRVPISKLLLFVAIVIVVHPQQASGELHLTYRGTICLGSVKSKGSKYYCDSIDRGETEIKTMMCSPKNQMTVKGEECRSKCAQRGEDYYWCYLSSFSFSSDYCGPVWDNYNYITSTYEALCYDQCAKTSWLFNYYWCNTRKGWDYCSPRPKVDYQNNPCKASHPCAKHDKSYYWCNSDKVGWRVWGWKIWYDWGYCGLHTPKTSFFRSTFKKLCESNCEYYSFFNRYYCYTSEGWDYCSPGYDVTCRGVFCRYDHSCDLHGHGYYWCYTDNDNSWDYCGLIEGVECQYSHRLRTKRQARQDLYQCTDLGNRVMVVFEPNTAANIARQEGSRLESAIQEIISMWTDESLRGTNQIRSQLERTDEFRIDMQGMVNRGNQRYYNLQIQRNVPRQSGQSTTYSQVLLPENPIREIPSRYVRRAFNLSYEDRAGITIIVSRLEDRRQD